MTRAAVETLAIVVAVVALCATPVWFLVVPYLIRKFGVDKDG